MRCSDRCCNMLLGCDNRRSQGAFGESDLDTGETKSLLLERQISPVSIESIAFASGNFAMGGT